MLTREEESIIKEVLQREPMAAEIATLDALWSEHCSYKSSKRWFHLFNTQGDRIYLGIGEGAGLVDVGDGYVIGLGLESHNHPSAVDPFNGAATGVGGIIRDILSQGCRPIAILDSLRFGMPEESRQKLLLDQVVLGISSYGNCVGIPNLGGDLEFADEFALNPLVNAMCVGIAKKEEIIRSVASTPGEILLLFGSKTGRDGIGGVTFASEELDEGLQESRSSIQIGDPLTEKLLIDAVLKIRDRGLISGLQDLGGGGLVCAAVEMAERGKTGVQLFLESVPTREPDMKAWELLVSESQERMLAVLPEEHLDEVTQILDELELSWAVVGRIADDNEFIGSYFEQIEARLPVDFTINGFPEPRREVAPVTARKNLLFKQPSHHPLIEMLGSFNIASRHPIYQQYDQHVQGNTVEGPGHDAGVIRLPNGKYLALACGTNSYQVSIDPFKGAVLATLSIVRNVIARGALPIAMVDSLNAGNPEKPQSYAEFVEMLKGVAEVSHKMEVPVVGGNVSLYNESEQEGDTSKILPSPFVGIAGLIEDEPIPYLLQDVPSVLVLVGGMRGFLAGSEYGRRYGFDDAMNFDLEKENRYRDFILSNKDKFFACTDVGRGGLLVTLAKWAIQSEVGMQLDLTDDPIIRYGEFGPRYLIQVDENSVDHLKMQNDQIEMHIIGKQIPSKEFVVDRTWTLKSLKEIWYAPLVEALEI